MHQLTAYLMVQTIALRLNPPTTLRNTVMWNKPLKVYKGVDNAFELLVHDFDQQPVPITDFTARIRAVDATGNYALDKALAIKTGYNNRLDLQILKEDTEELEAGFYEYSVTLSADGVERPLYFEQNGEAIGTLEILNGPFAV